MAVRKEPSKGGKPDKLMRDAIMLALHREAKDADGKKTKKLNIVAAKLVDLAVAGEMPAIKEVIDRVDGKSDATLNVNSTAEVTIRSAAISALDELIAAAAGRTADSADENALPN